VRTVGNFGWKFGEQKWKATVRTSQPKYIAISLKGTMKNLYTSQFESPVGFVPESWTDSDEMQAMCMPFETTCDTHVMSISGVPVSALE